MANKKESMTTQDLTTILSTALAQIMTWMPEENRSKAIVIQDPRDPTQLCAVHNGPEGITLLMGQGFKDFCKELLCDMCISNLRPFSVIYTGFNLETGEFDEEAYIGLHGSHDEDVNASLAEPDETEIQPSSVFTIRKLN